MDDMEARGDNKCPIMMEMNESTRDLTKKTMKADIGLQKIWFQEARFIFSPRDMH